MAGDLGHEKVKGLEETQGILRHDVLDPVVAVQLGLGSWIRLGEVLETCRECEAVFRQLVHRLADGFNKLSAHFQVVQAFLKLRNLRLQLDVDRLVPHTHSFGNLCGVEETQDMRFSCQ